MIGCTLDEPRHLFVVGMWEKPDGPRRRDWKVSRAEVDEAVTEAFSTYNVVELAANPFGWRSEIETWAKRYGEAKVLAWPTNTHKPSHLWACAICHQRIDLLASEVARRRQLSQGSLTLRPAPHPFKRSRGDLDQPM